MANPLRDIISNSLPMRGSKLLNQAIIRLLLQCLQPCHMAKLLPRDTTKLLRCRL